MKFLLILTALLLVQACRHPLAIEGEGDIIERLTGHRGCTLEEFQSGGTRCTENEVVDKDYVVSYEAVPRPGWRFLWWDGTGCPPDSVQPYCDYNVSRDVVNYTDENSPDFVFDPTVAVFAENTLSVSVTSKANGGFGPVLGGNLINPALKEMVLAVELAAGQAATLIAVGEINIATNNPEGIFVPPSGSDFPAENRPAGGFYYFPLEEMSVDAGDLVVPISNVALFNVGALIGAFVAQENVVAENFKALNDDPDADMANFPTPKPIIGGIPADGLFVVGGGPFKFTAPANGTLFLGVNDADVTNNAGKFRVSISVD